MDIKVLDLTINEQDKLIGSPTYGRYFSCLVLSVEGGVYCESVMLTEEQVSNNENVNIIVGKHLMEQMLKRFPEDSMEMIRGKLYGY